MEPPGKKGARVILGLESDDIKISFAELIAVLK